jgi:predicted dehydrogenase
MTSPRLGFLGVGWIGRNRMEAIARSGAAEVCAVVDGSDEVARTALDAAPGAKRLDSLDGLLDAGLDGLVIATPSALHADQTIAALDRGIAVFCQKPLARTADEVARVVDAARRADRLLAVDLSYRFTRTMRAIRELIAAGELGEVYAVDLVFHNAYGPDKAWFREPSLAGGGCVIDLGVHLVDLAMWTLDFPRVGDVSSRLFANGRPLEPPIDVCEDFAMARFTLGDRTEARLACSWNLPAGRDCVIEASFFATKGGAALRNVNGSFYDFVGERYRGTSREILAEPPDDWGARAAVDWAERLARGDRYDDSIERMSDVARVLDAIYGRPSALGAGLSAGDREFPWAGPSAGGRAPSAVAR